MTTTQTTSPVRQLEPSPLAERLLERSFNRARTHGEHQRAITAHHELRAERLDEIVEELRERGTQETLAELRRAGLLWSAVAQIVGVTDTAVRKWRKGQTIEATHERRLRRLAALARLYREYVPTAPPSGFGEWLDTRVVEPFSATPLQLLALTRNAASVELQPLLDWMLEHEDRGHGEALLDRYIGTSWRDEAREEQRFRIVTNAAGERVLLVDE